MSDGEKLATILKTMDQALVDLLRSKDMTTPHIEILNAKKLHPIEKFGNVGTGDKSTALRLLSAALSITDDDLADGASLTSAWVEANRLASASPA